MGRRAPDGSQSARATSAAFCAAGASVPPVPLDTSWINWLPFRGIQVQGDQTGFDPHKQCVSSSLRLLYRRWGAPNLETPKSNRAYNRNMGTWYVFALSRSGRLGHPHCCTGK